MAEFNPCLSEQEDEVLALSSIFGDDFSTLDNDECGAVYKIKIKVNLVGKKLQLCAWLPAEEEPDTERETEDDGRSPAVSINKISFKRSESRQHSCLQLSVAHLTPLTLQFSFPSSYPASAKPLYTLSCLWLDVENLSRLCEKLDELWEATHEEAIIFPWTDWLQSSSLEYLGAYECVNIKPYVWDQDGSVKQDPRALTEFCEPKSSALAILHHDYHMEQQQFRKENHTCEICFEEREGILFHFLHECGHKFCVECLLDYCQMHVREGTVRQLLCPENKCNASLSPMILRELLSEEDFERWERLLFEQTLAGMLDILYCPRCNNVVIQDEDVDSKLAQCHDCFFSFCTECHSNWHSARPCGADEETAQPMMLKKKKQKSKNFVGNDEVEEDGELVNMSKKKHKSATATTYDFLMLQKRLGRYQRCPKCRIMVERIAGCDMMHCTRCGQAFCWRCGFKISGYNHFQTCGTVTQENIHDRARAMLDGRPVAEAVTRMRALAEDYPRMQMKLKKCPRCAQKNMKEHRNNHVKCWSCKLDFCYQCSKPTGTPVSVHFKAPSTCPQHSDD